LPVTTSIDKPWEKERLQLSKEASYQGIRPIFPQKFAPHDNIVAKIPNFGVKLYANIARFFEVPISHYLQ